MSRMQPPKNPKEAIASRRNPCYGFAVLAGIQENKRLMSIFTETRDAILTIVDPKIDEFHLISDYDKRTLSLKHFSMYTVINSDNILKI